MTQPRDPEQMRQSMDRDGYVALHGFLGDERVREVEANMRRFIAEVVPKMPVAQVYYEDKSRPETLKQLQKLFQYDEFFHRLMFGSEFEEAARILLRGDVVGLNMQYFNKPPGVGQATPAHQDGFYFKLSPPEAVTMWLALDNVDESNGCVRYVRGSQLRGLRPHGKTGTLGFSQGITDYGNAEDLAGEVAMTARPGDLLVHHALTIHRADANRNPTRSRRAIGLIYHSVRAKTDEAAVAAYMAKLNQDLQEKGKI